MSIAAPKNTLLYQRKGRPLTLKRDISSAPITGVASNVRAFAASAGGNVAPEAEAVMFYLTNHALKELEFRFDPEEPLPDWAMNICEEYHLQAAKIGARAFYYLLLITAREARHNHNKHDMKPKIAQQFGEGPAMALLHYPDQNNVEEVTKVFDQYGNAAPLGDICRSIVYTFYEGKFSGGYGGKKWGNVADCMTAFVTGEYTAEMMLDTVWTLVHNGGPIFNKGMLYQTQNNQALQMVLDIQRAGQIPRLVQSPTMATKMLAPYISSEARQFAKVVSQHLGEGSDFEPGVPVDFAQVMALGAVGSYGHLASLAEQPDPIFAPKPHVAPAQPAQPAQQPTEKTHYIIAQAPGMMFPKLTRAQLKD